MMRSSIITTEQSGRLRTVRSPPCQPVQGPRIAFRSFAAAAAHLSALLPFSIFIIAMSTPTQSPEGSTSPLRNGIEESDPNTPFPPLRSQDFDSPLNPASPCSPSAPIDGDVYDPPSLPLVRPVIISSSSSSSPEPHSPVSIPDSVSPSATLTQPKVLLTRLSPTILRPRTPPPTSSIPVSTSMPPASTSALSAEPPLISPPSSMSCPSGDKSTTANLFPAYSPQSLTPAALPYAPRSFPNPIPVPSAATTSYSAVPPPISFEPGSSTAPEMPTHSLGIVPAAYPLTQYTSADVSSIISQIGMLALTADVDLVIRRRGHRNGGILLTVLGDATLQWLEQTVPGLMLAGHSARLCDSGLLTPSVMLLAWCNLADLPYELILKAVSRSNPGIDTSQWTLRSTPLRSINGQEFKISVPSSSWGAIRYRGRRLDVGGFGHVRFSLISGARVPGV